MASKNKKSYPQSTVPDTVRAGTVKVRKPVRAGSVNATDVTDIVNSNKSVMASNEDIMLFFPDIEIASNILTSSIISPNDMRSNKLTYRLSKSNIIPSINAQVMEVIRGHVNTHYHLEDGLSVRLRESLVTKGAYINLLVPDNALHDLLGKQEVITLDSLSAATNATTGMGLIKETPTSYTHNMVDLYNGVPIGRTVTVTNDELGIGFSDNYNVMNAAGVIRESVNSKISTVFDKHNDASITNNARGSYRRTMADAVKAQEVVNILSVDDLGTMPGSVPMRINLPAECVVVIHSASDPGDHLGYLVALDDKMQPVTFASSTGIETTMNQELAGMDTKSAFISKAKTSLLGMTTKAPTLANAEALYTQIMESKVASQVKNSVYESLGEATPSNELYKMMFTRMLQGKKTKLLFLPTDLVTYYAFDYRNNGTGKSIIEKSAVLFSLRAMLKLSRINAAITNSTPNVTITAQLDADSVDPDKDKALIMAESNKTIAGNFPVGTTNIMSLSDWANRRGYRYVFKHPAFPEMEIDYDDTGRSVIEPDGALEDSLREQTIMAFSLTVDQVDAGKDSDLATKIALNNVLFTRRVMELQDKFTTHITKEVKTIMVNDGLLRRKITKALELEMPSIKKGLRAFLKDTNPDILAELLADDSMIIDYLLTVYTNDITVTLPRPDEHEDTGTKEALDNFISGLDDFMPLILGDDAMPAGIMGDIGDKIEEVIPMVKTVLIRNWMSDNNYLPELTNMLRTGLDGKPKIDILSEYKDHSEALVNAVLPVLKELQALGNKTDDKLYKIEDGDDDDDDKESETPAENKPDEDGVDDGDVESAEDDIVPDIEGEEIK